MQEKKENRIVWVIPRSLSFPTPFLTSPIYNSESRNLILHSEASSDCRQPNHLATIHICIPTKDGLSPICRTPFHILFYSLTHKHNIYTIYLRHTHIARGMAYKNRAITQRWLSALQTIWWWCIWMDWRIYHQIWDNILKSIYTLCGFSDIFVREGCRVILSQNATLRLSVFKKKNTKKQQQVLY